jgi:NADP-dependent 3-hydroxy acid dehydrogenase YdfG
MGHTLIQKTAIVTGASKGVGKATVKLLQQNNYKVIALSRNLEAMKELQSDNVEINQVDITDSNQIKEFFTKYKDISLDLLVNNAGGGAGPTFIINETMENFRMAYDINVSGPMYLSQLFVPCMKKSDSPTIVFVTSLCGKIPFRGGGNYSNAKRGQMALIDTMRMEFPEYGIKISEICPGSIDTDVVKKDNAISAEDMAEAIRWVASMPKTVNVNHIEISHIYNGKFI